MRRHIINTIFKKEIKEVLRDKRMLYLVILLPFFLYPVLFTVIGGVGKSQQDKLANEKVTILMNPDAEQTAVYDLLKQDTILEIEFRDFSKEDLEDSKNTIGLEVPADFNEKTAAGTPVPISILANRSKDLLKFRQDLINGQLSALNTQILQQKLATVDIDPEFANPLQVSKIDITPEEQQSGRFLAAMLPMMILLFIFIGCIYIAIDITAGEKERRTLQTLFTTPVTTKEIIAGKFLAVASVGIVSAFMNIISLFVAIAIQTKIMGEGPSSFSLAISPADWGWLVLLVLLATLFLGALSLAVVLLANSYKEAQSYVSPLMMMVMIPAILATMPGMELNFQMAMVPMLNIALAISEIFKGGVETSMLAIVAASSLLYGLLALFFAGLTFGNENVITGQKVGWKTLFGK